MISIITPHFNDFEGIKHIYDCLKKQTSNLWEWLVIDDFSEEATRTSVEDFLQTITSPQIQLILNESKRNASVCRNVGIDHARYNHLVFLDSDDFISEDFVANRLIEVEEFVIFSNYYIKNEHGEISFSNVVLSNSLDHFLKAHFIWQTTAILWDKAFLIKIGKFDPNLERLQDVELAIRALLTGKNYKIIDNNADFFYCVKPIRLRTNFVAKVCVSVNYLISKLHTNYSLGNHRQSLIKGYYYLCVKYLHRSEKRKDIVYVKESLKLFYKKKYIGMLEYSIGHILLDLFKFKLISDDLFIRTNRYLFKP